MICPCCSGLLLPHIRSDAQIHWFCRHCWQDMPVFSRKRPVYFTGIFVERFSPNFQNKQQPINADSTSQLQTINRSVDLQDVLV